MSEQKGIRSGPPRQLELAKDAIDYTLSRIRDDENIRYHMGAFTEVFERLKAAHCSINGISEEALEAEIFGRELKRKAAAQIVSEIRDALGRDICDKEKLSKISQLLNS